MRPLPRFWSPREAPVTLPDGRQWLLRVWGWSATSAQDAATVAAERLRVLAGHLTARTMPEGWYYPRTPPREEVLTEVHDGAGELVGVVTRNRYGAEVLNTEVVLVADLDLPQEPARRRRWPFGRAAEPATPDPQTEALHRCTRFAAEHPAYGVRTYRTRAGLRLLVTGTGLAPDSGGAAGLLADLRSDPLYAALCQAHGTYRARLTPKPWRCGHRSLSIPWPHRDEVDRRVAARWVHEYLTRSEGYATCRLLSVAGPEPAEGEVRLVRLHDEVTRASTGAPLA